MAEEKRSPPVQPGAGTVIWQGYHHAWEYNHRLNRFGSYVRQPQGCSADAAIIGHTAASGTGNDTAHFIEFVTPITAARGVAFQAGHVEATAECQRGDMTPFILRVDDLELAPELQNRDHITVVLNGFDLYATSHSEKLMTLDLEVTDPTVTDAGTRVRFRILGELRFDCRSTECQMLPIRLEAERLNQAATVPESAEPIGLPSAHPRQRRGIDRRKVDRIARWLKRQLTQLTDVEAIKRSMVGDEGDTFRRRLFRFAGRRIYLRFLKWRLSAPYVIRVHYLIIAGDRDALTVSESPEIVHEYAWDLEHEIHQSQTGVCPVTVQGDDPSRYALNTLAFRRLFADVAFDEEQGSDDPIQWGQGMHMLAWTMAIRDIRTTGEGVTAALDLFYKNWSEAMNEVITLTTWGAVRAAGRARLGARLALLQFREAEGDQQVLPGRIYWPGAGRSAVHAPQAHFERRLTPKSSERT